MASFWSALKTCEEVKGASAETDIVRWTFKDGHVCDVKMDEHSVCSSVSPCPVQRIENSCMAVNQALVHVQHRHLLT